MSPILLQTSQWASNKDKITCSSKVVEQMERLCSYTESVPIEECKMLRKNTNCQKISSLPIYCFTCTIHIRKCFLRWFQKTKIRPKRFDETGPRLAHEWVNTCLFVRLAHFYVFCSMLAHQGRDVVSVEQGTSSSLLSTGSAQENLRT